MVDDIPKLSSELKSHSRCLSKDTEDLVHRTFGALSYLDGYKNLSPSIQSEVRDSLELCAKLWFDSLITGHPPSQQSMNVVESIGCRRMHQGIPLQSVLRAFRIGSAQIWGQFIELAEKEPALRDELLFQVSPYLLEFFDVMAQSISNAYLKEQYNKVRWRESLSYQLCNIIFNFDSESKNFSNIADTLGLDSGGPRIALAMSFADVDSIISSLDTDKVLVAVARYLKVTTDNLLGTWNNGRFVIWVPAMRGDSINTNDHAIAGQVAALTSVVPGIRMLGIGLMGYGADGWADSAKEAALALDYGISRGHGIHMYSDVAVQETVRTCRSVQRYIVSIIEDLSVQPELLQTLEVFLQHSRQHKVTSNELGIHPNTLAYRLGRIEKILGADLNDLAWLAKLDVALKLR